MTITNSGSIPLAKLGAISARCACIDDVDRELGDTLDALGWHRQRSTVSLTLHRIRKNGAPLKTPDVELWYEEFHVDIVYEEDANGDLIGKELPPTRKRDLPWVVRGRAVKGRAYATLPNAVEKFVGIALHLAPAA